jgi:tetratricopeptide (TPR) repeat protein
MSRGVAILAGGHREDKIGGAIESALGLVDEMLLVDTGESAQAAIAVARGILGSRCRVVEYPGTYYQCAHGRNFCLEQATALGLDCVILLDTDERLIWNDAAAVHSELDAMRSSGVGWSMTWNDLQTYPKARAFHLPTSGRYDGEVHEGFCVDTPGALMTTLAFHELQKTTEELGAHVAAIEKVVRRLTREDPGNARWRYYLGDCLAYQARGNATREAEAIEAFTTAAVLTGWEEERDWSYYRIADVHSKAGRYHDAFRALETAGMRIPEHAWLAAYCLHRAGENDRAVYWAQKAARIAAQQRDALRVGFNYKFAQFEGPFDVLDHAYRALGETELAKDARVKVEQMIALRESLGPVRAKAPERIAA